MKRNKYNNRIVVVNGIKFHSQKEAKRYAELLLLLREGVISDLATQVPYLITVNGKKICRYVADFVYRDLQTHGTVVEDVKGYRTEIYKLKKKLVEAIYDFKITEI